MVDWNNNNKRKAFRLALQRVYPNPAELSLFVDEELNENLAVIAANNNLQATAGGLVSWAQAKSRLNEVFEAFCRENPKDPAIAELRQQPLIERSSHLGEEEWETLFAQFYRYDFADIQRAFLRGFQQAVKADFQSVRPDLFPLTEQAQIQALLTTTYGQPELAVRFVESVMVEFQRSSEGNGRDLTGLEQWRDRIAQQYNVSLLAPEPDQKAGRQGYLLVTFKECGSDVIVSPQLRVTGEENPIPFGVSPVRCAFEEVPNYLSDWIYRAETALDGKHDHEEVLLELFLPCALLEEDLVTTWRVKDERGKPILLSRYRRFVVRSFDRLEDYPKQNRNTKKFLERKWQLLKNCVSAGNAGDNFHLQEECPKEDRDLFLLLEDVPGLKFAAKLPSEREKREGMLYEMIDAAVPIALWSPSADEAMLAELKTQMHDLCRESHLTNFADLAGRWRRKLAQSETEAVKHIRLLCDCPDRLPNLPDPDREDDLLVA